MNSRKQWVELIKWYEKKTFIAIVMTRARDLLRDPESTQRQLILSTSS